MRLTPAQRDALKCADSRLTGQVGPYDIRQTTINALSTHGYIAKDYWIRDARERSEYENNMLAYVELATMAILTNWHMAFNHLKDANDAHRALERTCYYITEAGRQYLRENVK